MRLWPLPDDSLGTLGLPERLLLPSLRQRVCESSSLSAWSFPFGGLPPFSRLFLSWRPCWNCSLIPSLAPSWWWPCPRLRWALLMLSDYVLSMPSAFSLRRSRWSIPSHCRPSCAVSLLMVSVIGARFTLAEGRLPMRLVPSEPLGSCGGSTYIALHRTWLVSTILPCAIGAQVGVSYFTARRSARIHGDHFVSFTDSSFPLGDIPWTLTRRVTGFTYCPPPRSSRTLSFALTYSHDSLILMHPAIDIVWQCPCLPRLRLL